MRTVQGDADTFLVWQAKSNLTTLVTMQHGVGWPGRSEVGASIVQPAPYVEVGKEIVFVTDLVVEPDITVFANQKYDFQVNGGITGQTVVLLNWGETLVARELGLYGHLKYSRFVLTGIDVLLPERFYDIDGVRPADPVWGVTPGTSPVGVVNPLLFDFKCSINIGFTSSIVDENNNNKFADANDILWTFGGESGANFAAGNASNGCVVGTSSLPAMVGHTFVNGQRMFWGNLVCLEMTNRCLYEGVPCNVTVPAAASKLWRLRVVLRGYVA